MKYEEVTPHLNKIARVHFKNNKRKICWLFLDEAMEEIPGKKPNKVSCVNVPLGRKFIKVDNAVETKELKPFAKTIFIRNIMTIRSSK